MALRISGSIGTKIFGAFVAMSLVTAGLGAFGLYVLSDAGGYVAGTFDGPLMAVNYARAASLQFVEMDKEILRRGLVAPDERPAIDRRLDQLTTDFFQDLAVADERSLAADERTVIREIRALVMQWAGVRRAGNSAGLDRNLDGIAEKVIKRFDRLTELTVDHSFVARRKALSAVAQFRNSSIAAIAFALLLSATITFLLARRIITPLAAAAAVADRIAGGELDTPIPAGGVDETGALLRSMTVMQDNIRAMMEREQAQRRSAQSRLVAALESSPEAMVLVDANGRAVIANSQLTVFFPPLARQLGTDANFAAVFRDVAERLVTRIAPAGGRAGDAPADWSDLLAAGGEFQLSDGQWLRASRSGTPEGGYFLVLSDISELKEREANLFEAKRQAEAASEAKSHFLTNMSHELRTPLNAIIGFGELMSAQPFGTLGDARYQGYVGDILTSGRHLLDIINSVLDLARSQAGRLQLNSTTVDLGSIFADCVAMMRDQCARARLELAIDLPRPPPLIAADPAKLRQIILNLLSNAVKFTEPGGRVRLSAAMRLDGTTEILVADSGIGMSPDHVVLALTPFSQVDTRLARRYEGTGLGLPLTKALVELHSGTLTIVSALGQGTTVSFTLPPRAGAAPPSDALPASAHNLTG